jgi:hypothetical protein
MERMESNGKTGKLKSKKLIEDTHHQCTNYAYNKQGLEVSLEGIKGGLCREVSCESLRVEQSLKVGPRSHRKATPGP